MKLGHCLAECARSKKGGGLVYHDVVCGMVGPHVSDLVEADARSSPLGRM
jgi:hypothetical protein